MNCRVCGEDKPNAAFYPSYIRYGNHICRECELARKKGNPCGKNSLQEYLGTVGIGEKVICKHAAKQFNLSNSITVGKILQQHKEFKKVEKGVWCRV